MLYEHISVDLSKRALHYLLPAIEGAQAPDEETQVEIDNLRNEVFARLNREDGDPKAAVQDEVPDFLA